MPEHVRLWQALGNASRARWVMVLIVLAFAVRLPVFFGTFASGDEATYCALAGALLDGHRLYVGAVDHKPPLIAATYAAVLAFGGSKSLPIVHALSILVVCATAFLLSAVAERAGLTLAERRAAALLYVLSASTGPTKDMLAANGEILMALPAVAAVAVAWSNQAAESHQTAGAWRWITAGGLAATAALFKYQGLAILAPIAVLAARQERPPRPVWVRSAWISAGVGAPLAALVGWTWQAGDLESFSFWMWSYPLRYAGMLPARIWAANALTQSAEWGLLSAGLLFMAVMGWRIARDEGGPTESGLWRCVAAIWFAAALTGVAAGGRFYLHYYLQLLPPLCLLAAHGAGRMAAARPPHRTMCLAAGLVLLPLAGWWVVNANPARFHPQRVAADAAYRAIADVVAERSDPSESIFIWGNSPEIYYYSGRRMGTRFAFCNYLSGKIWGTPADQPGGVIDPTLIVEPAWQMLFSDLDLRRPSLIVDAAAAGLDRWQGHEIAVYPRLAAVVASRYRRVANVAGADIYELVYRGAGSEHPNFKRPCP